MSCKWSPKSDDYKYDACEEYDLICNDESENYIATLFQPNDSTDKVESLLHMDAAAEISFQLRQTGIPAEFQHYNLSNNRTGINLLEKNPFTVTGFPKHPIPSEFFKLGDSTKLTPNVKKDINEGADNAESTNTNCLVVKLPEESSPQEFDGAVGLSEDFVTIQSEENAKKKKKKKESSKQKLKNVTSKKSKKVRWTAIQIPEVDIFANQRPNLLNSLRPA